jgi:ectoine hydroxylase-related dioxygenase (phytanoyl-CoA dioxygenase family)
MTVEAETALAPFLQGRSFASWREEYDTRGFVVFERVLGEDQIAAVRAALAPWFAEGRTGRNDFEGLKTNRVYALLAKSPVFAELAIHPLALAFAEAELGPTCLLSACLAINLHPGETVQPWHTDDGGIAAPRPRPAYGVSAFWAIDDTTEENGATEIIPGSHLWARANLDGGLSDEAFADRTVRDVSDDPGGRSDAVKMVMPAGSLAIAKGTLIHRGGANRSGSPRLIITPQYCAGWARQLENMVLAVPPEVAARLPERARELLGYSIHPPFMGYVDGVHPRRLLPS